ncbi:MAG: hypothetical protein AAFR29_08725 [Pseudomonadota bacterium]
MTIVCALYDDDNRRFWLGCNSGSLVGKTILPEHQTKWLRFANWALALSGAGIAVNAVAAERAKFPNQTEDVNQVIAFLRAAFAKYDMGEMEGNAKDYDVSGLLVHNQGAFYDVDTRLSTSKIPTGALWARGSGMEYALGADMALKLKGFTPQERLETAVLTAIDLDSGCPGEPIVESFA